MTIQPIQGLFAVCQIRDASEIDFSRPFTFAARTDAEISLVCPAEAVPADTVRCEDGWRAFRIAGMLDFSLTGVLARISPVLAEEKIAIFAVSTYDTDYVLTKKENFDRALETLAKAGYEIAAEEG